MADDRRTLPIVLNSLEVLYLTDAIGNADADQGDVDQPSRIQNLARPLLLKLGSAYRELIQESGYDRAASVMIQVTERECWLMRGKVASGTTGMDKSVIGVGLLRKLYGVLLEFNAQAVTNQFEQATVDDQDFDPAKVKQLIAEEEARGDLNATD